ncbi:hypothetical protein KJ660_04290 [Candidatus Micrarchaeota archaeon]|nr:hypothetical protein [Candidatus Micrarchaeota archaeon]
MIVRNALGDYFENIKLSLLFGVLLVFVFFFLFFSNLFISSGSIFLEYSLNEVNIGVLALEIAVIAVFLVFYSAFVSLIIFNVRNKLNKVKVDYYLKDKLHRFSLKLFVFLLVYFIVLFFLSSLLVFFSLPVWIVNLLLLIVSLFFLFLPQAIVVDEDSITHCIANNLEFMSKNILPVIKIIVVSMVLIAVIALAEYALDVVALIGRYISLIILLVFVVPFIEVMKTRLYMTKFTLIGHKA